MLKHMHFLFATLMLITGCASENFQPRENHNRKQRFDFNWKFMLGDAPSAKDNEFNDNEWRTLDLPHDWSIEGKPDPTNPTAGGGGYFPSGIGWYRKTFDVPSDWQGKRVSIYFEGVYMNAEVFINGTSLGVHPYGYTSFYYDLTPYLKFNESNIIAVRVDNSQQTNCRWYSGSGIYRHVWLQVTDPVHIGQWGVAITTPDVSSKKASVQVKTLVKNDTDKPQNIVLSTELTDKNFKNVGNHEVQVELKARSEKQFVQSLTVNNPALWSPENPNLYRAHSKLIRGKEEIDMTTTRFGIRSIDFSAEDGFKLNGESVVLNGGCVHHDNGCLGAAAYDRAEERKVELLKSAGFNAVRTSHNPPSEAFLDACDRLGLLVIDESFDGWRESKTPHDYSNNFDDWSQRDVESMVLRDRNHPSIIMWSTGNEIIERTKPEAIETANKLANWVRQIDPTRPLTSAMTTWGQGWKRFDTMFAAHDVGGYNYQLHEAPSDHERVPSRIIVQTESYPKDTFWVWDMVQKHNYIIGDFVWTAMDYLGESGIGRYYYPGEPDGEHWQTDLYPWHGAYCGDIDLTGWRKPISHYRNLLWNEDEKLYMAVREPNPVSGEIKLTMWAVWPTWESWNWPGYEGSDIQVEVFSKYPSVRLYLNDEIIGELPTGREQEFKAIFTTPYEPGELRAVGLNGDAEVETKVLKTTGLASRIKLTADRTDIQADGQDMSFITVEIIDDDGNLVPNVENHLSCTISGEGVLAGVDNGNLRDIKLYNGNSVSAWHGRALAVIKSTHNSGDIELTVNSPGLSSHSLRIKSARDK